MRWEASPPRRCNALLPAQLCIPHLKGGGGEGRGPRRGAGAALLLSVVLRGGARVAEALGHFARPEIGSAEERNGWRGAAAPAFLLPPPRFPAALSAACRSVTCERLDASGENRTQPRHTCIRKSSVHATGLLCKAQQERGAHTGCPSRPAPSGRDSWRQVQSGGEVAVRCDCALRVCASHTGRQAPGRALGWRPAES